MNDIPNEQVISKLNGFLRGEISAVETYRQALEKITDSSARAQLQDCERNHQARADQLRSRISGLGGTPAKDSGAWGAWAKLFEGTAKVFGDKAAIGALEQGEDHGLADYRRDLESLDGDTRAWVQTNLLPQAERTHGTLSTMKRTLH